MPTDRDLTDLLTRLEAEAEKGRLAGLICIPMYAFNGKRRYTLAVAGWAAKNPTYAAGAMAACNTLIREMALRDAGVASIEKSDAP